MVPRGETTDHPIAAALAGAAVLRPQLQRVCLLLADLSGYTAYLASAEPDHAPALAGDLVETVVRQLRPAFRLVKLEGDAAFLVAPLDALDGTTLLDAIDAAYDAFRRRLQGVAAATTCDCVSCRRVPDLDLKFVVHAGQVVRHRVAGRDELAGTDAIIAHRLLKAETPAAAGVIRYALFSDRCVAELGIDPIAQGMSPGIERFEHLGAVPVHLLDLDHRPASRGRPWTPPRRAPLAEADLLVRGEPMAVWTELTSPHRRPAWEGIEQIEETSASGRRGVGTMSACVAERLSSIEEILEWRPFEAFVRRAEVAGVGRVAVRHELVPEGSATRLRSRWYGARTAAPLAIGQRDRLIGLAARMEASHADR